MNQEEFSQEMGKYVKRTVKRAGRMITKLEEIQEEINVKSVQMLALNQEINLLRKDECAEQLRLEVCELRKKVRRYECMLLEIVRRNSTTWISNDFESISSDFVLMEGISDEGSDSFKIYAERVEINE